MTKSLTTFKREALANKQTKAEYDALAPQYALIQSIIKHRIQKGWSQTELAQAIGTKQPVISRLEKGITNPSIDTLQKVARALGLSLHISMK